MDLAEIKEKYSERYRVYMDILLSQKNTSEIHEGDLNSVKKWIQALNNMDAYIETHTPHRENLDARSKRQLTVFEDIRDHLEQGKKEGYVKLPTGVGKTVLFSKITESLGLKTLIVVPSKILITQTGEKIEEFTDMDFGKYFQGEKNLNENVTITTYLSLVRAVKEGTINPADYDALILDEAHKALGEETSKVIDRFDAVKLGFTATPKYSKDKHVSDLLEHEMHSMTIIEAAQEKLVSRFKSYIAYTDTDISAVKIKNREKYDPDELEKAINQESRNRSAVELYKQQFQGHLAIAYCGGVTHAEHVADMFNKDDIKAEVISGDTPDDEKEKILARYNSGETKVLCNARILIEGFDEPKATVCLNLQPTLSHVDAEQRAGRVLRLDPDNPDKWAYIVDFVDKGASTSTRTFAEIAQASEVDKDQAVTFKDFGQGGEGEKEGEKEGEGKEPKTVPDIIINGLRVVVDAREVLKIGLDFEQERQVERKQFLTLDLLKKEVVEAGIKSIVQYQSASQEHDDWPSAPHEMFSNKGWISWNDLFGKENLTVPEGWISLNGMRDVLDVVSITATKNITDRLRKKPDLKSEWGTYTVRNVKTEYFSPSFVKLVEDELKLRQGAPDGWQTAGALRAVMHRDDKFLKKKAEEVRGVHPEWFKRFRDKSGKMSEHYSPELIAHLMQFKQDK